MAIKRPALKPKDTAILPAEDSREFFVVADGDSGDGAADEHFATLDDVIIFMQNEDLQHVTVIRCREMGRRTLTVSRPPVTVGDEEPL